MRKIVTLSAQEALEYCNGKFTNGKKWKSVHRLYACERSGMVKSVDLVSMARQLHAKGAILTEVAEQLGLGYATVQRYCSGEPLGKYEAKRFTESALDKLIAAVATIKQGSKPLSRKHEAMLGTMPDSELAKLAGLSARTISRRREERGIPAFGRGIPAFGKVIYEQRTT